MIGCGENVDDDDDDGGSSSSTGWVVGKLSNDEYREWWGWTEEDWQSSPAEFLHSGEVFSLFFAQAKATEASSKC